MSENRDLPKGLFYYECEGLLIINCDEEFWEKVYYSDGYFKGFKKKIDKYSKDNCKYTAEELAE